MKSYSYSDLKSSTRNLEPGMVLGVGGFGTVYGGWVDEKTLEPSRHGTGVTVAVKKLNSGSVQGFHEWQEELEPLLHEYGHLHALAFLFIGKGMSDKALSIWRILARNYSAIYHKDQCEVTGSLEPLSWEMAAIEASRILEESSDQDLVLQHLGWGAMLVVYPLLYTVMTSESFYQRTQMSSA